jgi:hypothetical protein
VFVELILSQGIRVRLIKRGKKFASLTGVKHCSYRGTAYTWREDGVTRFDLNDRIVLDPEKFAQSKPSRRTLLESTEYVMKLTRALQHCTSYKPTTQHLITDEDLLIASPVARGFSISRKSWLEFSLTSVEDVEWDSKAFDRVVLPTHIKHRLQGMIISHSVATSLLPRNRPTGYRGTGLSIALHGPTGTGKSFTAVGIAEHLKRPLYSVTTSDLGTDAEFFEENLFEVIELVSRWNAILLVEDADLFVEARQPHDFHRNAIVSAFLRCMDLYHGVLFLTTRCLVGLDEAFQSRLQLGIDYDNEAAQERKEIWKYHVSDLELTEATEEYVSSWGALLSETDLEELGRECLTGRQVWLHNVTVVSFLTLC